MGLESTVKPDVNLFFVTWGKAERDIVLRGNGYIPQSTAAMAVNELFIVMDGRLKLGNGLVEAIMDSRVSVLKAVDQSQELQRLVEQLVFRIAGQFADED